MLIGYARVSTDNQSPDLQRDALKVAECESIFEDTASYANAARTGLAALIVNSDLKLVQFFIEQRFKTDTPLLHSHIAYAMAAGSIIAWGGFAWFQKTHKGFADVL